MGSEKKRKLVKWVERGESARGGVPLLLEGGSGGPPPGNFGLLWVQMVNSGAF